MKKIINENNKIIGLHHDKQFGKTMLPISKNIATIQRKSRQNFSFGKILLLKNLKEHISDCNYIDLIGYIILYEKNLY
jgi:uncharacterized protein YeeX (DUF496 family)